jgi:6-phosphogluconate dehydrogenase
MVSKVAIEYGIAVPAIMAAISYYDSYRSARLPHNLLQAQRDYFGAHTYERVDHPEGKLFHTNWSESEPLLLWVKKRTGEEPKRITP